MVEQLEKVVNLPIVEFIILERYSCNNPRPLHRFLGLAVLDRRRDYPRGRGEADRSPELGRSEDASSKPFKAL